MTTQLNIAPSEFWGMTPAEVSAILDANRPTHIDGIPEDDYEEMMLRRQQLIADGVDVI